MSPTFNALIIIALGAIIGLLLDMAFNPEGYNQQEVLSWDGYVPTEPNWFGKANTFCNALRGERNGHDHYECWVDDGTYFVHVLGDQL